MNSYDWIAFVSWNRILPCIRKCIVATRLGFKCELAVKVLKTVWIHHEFIFLSFLMSSFLILCEFIVKSLWVDLTSVWVHVKSLWVHLKSLWSHFEFIVRSWWHHSTNSWWIPREASVWIICEFPLWIKYDLSVSSLWIKIRHTYSTEFRHSKHVGYFQATDTLAITADGWVNKAWAQQPVFLNVHQPLFMQEIIKKLVENDEIVET